MKAMNHVHRITRLSVLLTVLVTLAWAPFASVASDAWPPPLGRDTIVYLQPGWDATAFVSNVAKILLERMGYKVDLKLTDVGLTYTALSGGTADVTSLASFPLQQTYLNKYPGKIDILSMAFVEAPTGLVVPGYVPIRSIEDLKSPSVKARMAGKIIGIDAGSGLMLTTAKVIKEYGLDYELVTGSSAAMLAAFKSAYEKKQWIVVIGWCPTALCGAFDFKFLADSKNLYIRSPEFHVAREGFRSDFPRATVFFSRLTFQLSALSQVVRQMQEDKVKADVAAQRWIAQNPELVYYWAGDLIPGFQKPTSLQ